jgi:hypothetical protein
MPSYSSFMCPNCETHFRVTPTAAKSLNFTPISSTESCRLLNPAYPQSKFCLFLPVTRTPTLTPVAITGRRFGHAGKRDSVPRIGP